ncbi:MAG: hypothetical protein AB1631_06225 [Acidobacteriota bacterium]
MNSRFVLVPFIASLFLWPAAFALTLYLGGADATTALTSRIFFSATVLIEIAALFQVARARKLFSRSDQGYITWTLILIFLIVRVLAESRLATMNYDLVPQDDSSQMMFFYVKVLRYLYTLSDLLFVAALMATIRSYKSTGLKFELMMQDYFYILLVCALPVLTFIFRENLMPRFGVSDSIYRLVAVSVGALIASLCLVIRRYALQMGGGAVARVWNTVAIAGIARDASFFALTLLTFWSGAAADFTDQYLLWIFACCWLMAALYQQEVLLRASTRPLTAR